MNGWWVVWLWIACLSLVVAQYWDPKTARYPHRKSPFFPTSLGSTRLGKSTHYGPWPSFQAYSEPGFLPNDVGVGCSDGRPGGDPRWNEILRQGTRKAPNFTQNAQTIWPKTHTVAVSQAAWGHRKSDICWQKLFITNIDTGKSIVATVVDFCPTGGCLWDPKEVMNNVDIYGEAAWRDLGADPMQGTMKVQISWPADISPAQYIQSNSWTVYPRCITWIAFIFIVLIN